MLHGVLLLFLVRAHVGVPSQVDKLHTASTEITGEQQVHLGNLFKKCSCQHSKKGKHCKQLGD
jgi:hypothetical protein